MPVKYSLLNLMSLTVFLSILSLITFVISSSFHHNTTESMQSIERCKYMYKLTFHFFLLVVEKLGQNGRVCMNSCYFNGQLTNCHKSNVLKSVLFDPPFSQILPSIHLKFVRIDSEWASFCNECIHNIFIYLHFSDDLFNEDVVIKKENLTSCGMNIRFNLLTESTINIICADWQACSLDSN
jgi:hypothetical protein